MTVFVARAADRLREVNDLIHDRICDVDRIHFESAAREVVVPFAQEHPERAVVLRRSLLRRRPTRLRVPLSRAYLRVRHVTDWTFDDPAETGSEELNIVEYDPLERRITLHGCCGLRLTAEVDELEVAVENSGDELGFRRVSIRLFGLAETSSGAIDAPDD